MTADRPPAPGANAEHGLPRRAGCARSSLAGRLTVPSCYDALGFRMIARAGFPAAFLSGFSVSAARLGAPDAGLLSYGEMAAEARDVAAAASIPLIVDADTGFGSAQNVQRTVRGLRRGRRRVPHAGGPGEPEAGLRRAGRGRSAVGRASPREGGGAGPRGRRRHPDHRPDRRAQRCRARPAGSDEALWRAAAFADLGADLVFVTGPHDARRSSGESARPSGCRRSSRWTSRAGRGARPAAGPPARLRGRPLRDLPRPRGRGRVPGRAGADGRRPAAAGGAGRSRPGEIGDIVGVQPTTSPSSANSKADALARTRSVQRSSPDPLAVAHASLRPASGRPPSRSKAIEARPDPVQPTPRGARRLIARGPRRGPSRSLKFISLYLQVFHVDIS